MGAPPSQTTLETLSYIFLKVESFKKIQWRTQHINQKFIKVEREIEIDKANTHNQIIHDIYPIKIVNHQTINYNF